MSRIETAMEKAALLRRAAAEDGAGVVPPEAAHKAAHVPPRQAQPLVTPRNPFLVNLLHPHSPIAEEYRKLKSQLVKQCVGESFRNTIMVTSALPNEGKSLTALNLAISLAQELDHTVLLVDADLRRPSLHRYLEVEQGVGLADVLLGEAELADTIVPTGIGKLSVVRAGRQVDNPGELFSSQKMKNLLAEMKFRYDDRYIIFDTSPVLPFAESRALGHVVDGILFVVMEQLPSKADVAEALDSLRGCDIMGMVYNAASVAPDEDRYAYYYGYKNSGR